MKTSQPTLILTAALMMATSAWASDLTGGYLNSKSREAALAIQDGYQRIQITSTATKLHWGNADYGSGKLYIIDARGNIQTARREFRDNAYHAVALPLGSDDKVVVLNRYGNIAWAMGLDDAEILRLVPRDKQALARVVVEAQKRPVFGALRYSSHILKNMRADADSVADMYLASIRWMAGNDVEQFVRHLKGISLVSQGGDGNGGTGLVAQGGDGNGGTGLVAQGGDGNGGTGIVSQGGDGNGGTGLVAQGGDGNGGTGIVSQGGDGNGGTGYVNDVEMKLGTVQSMAKIPAIKGLSAVAKGKVVILQ